jgi:hypothetical protein
MIDLHTYHLKNYYSTIIAEQVWSAFPPIRVFSEFKQPDVSDFGAFGSEQMDR